ncbi:Uncharacterised protein [Chlamydia trachomatis]|nr:Uncharacterised protein [Chlamydia trachomatis]
MLPELYDALTSLAKGSCDTVSSCIPAADYDDVLPLRVYKLAVFKIGIQQAFSRCSQVIHCKVNA